MNQNVCPNCGFSRNYCDTDRLKNEIKNITAWCEANGAPIVLGDCIRQSDAARYIGRATKTLKNWAGTDKEIPARHLRGRVYHSIQDIAQFVIGEN